MTPLKNSRVLALCYLLCIVSDHILQVNGYVCEVTRERNADNERRWMLPYENPCECTRIIMGLVNRQTPSRTFVPMTVACPLLSNDINEIRSHYGLECGQESASPMPASSRSTCRVSALALRRPTFVTSCTRNAEATIIRSSHAQTTSSPSSVEATTTKAVSPRKECESSWESFQSYCYSFANTGVTFYAAQAACEAMGSNLVSVHSQEEQDFVASNIIPGNIAGPFYWIGLTDEEAEGVFIWTDGTVNDYTNWTPDEPNNALYKEDCTFMMHTWIWNDLNCQLNLADWANAEYPIGYICKKSR